MKKFITSFILAMCLIVSVMFCVTDLDGSRKDFCGNKKTSVEAIEEQTQNAPSYSDVQEMINTLPNIDKLSQMGNSDKQKTYGDAQTIYDLYENLSADEMSRVDIEKLVRVLDYFCDKPEPLTAVSYGFLVNQTLVTSENLSGEGWSYNPNTATLTLGDENELAVGFSAIPNSTSNAWKKENIYDATMGDIDVYYTSIIQPQVVKTKNEENDKFEFSNDRPSSLKIEITGNVVFGNYGWRRAWTSSSDFTQRFVMGGILWDGDLEITGGGTLEMYVNTFAIYGAGSDKNININDVTLKAEAFNNVITSYDIFVKNASVDIKARSLGGAQVYRHSNDTTTKIVTYDSDTAVDSTMLNIENSEFNVEAVWNRNCQKEDEKIKTKIAQSVKAINGDVKVKNSSLEVSAYINEGLLPFGETQLYGISGDLDLYENAFVYTSAYASNDLVTNRNELNSSTVFCGLDGGKCTGYGNAMLVANSDNQFGKESNAIKSGLTILAGENVQSLISSPYSDTSKQGYRKIVEFKVKDTLYLREQGGTKQASWNMDFSNSVNLDSNIVNASSYTLADNKPCNIRVVSGNFTFCPLTNASYETRCEAIGGDLTIQLQNGSTYGDIQVVSAGNRSVTIQGNGVIENLTTSSCISVTESNYSREVGSLIFNGGTIKHYKMDENYVGNVSFRGGNVKVDNIDKDYYRTNIYDFSEVQGMVDLADGGIRVNISHNFVGSQLIDGKYYFYSAITLIGGPVDNIYVEPETGYNYYMIPEFVSSGNSQINYKFQRAEEKFYFIPEETIKNAYVSLEGSVTLEAGYLEGYVSNDLINGGILTRLVGSQTQTPPEGYYAKWSYTDKTGVVTELEGNSLCYIINEAVLDDEFRTYTCKVYSRGTSSDTLLGTYEVKPRIMIMSVGPKDTYVKVGDTVTLKLTVDENDRDGWRGNLIVAWQVRDNSESEWNFITNPYEHHPEYELEITSTEMIAKEYRAKLFEFIHPAGGQAVPDYYSESIIFYKRDDPKFNNTLAENIGGENGDEKLLSVEIKDGYLSSIDWYWESSQDNGNHWAKINSDSTFAISSITLNKNIIGGASVPYQTTSAWLTIKLNCTLNGVKIRTVIYDKLDNTYTYTNEAQIMVEHTWSTTEIIARVDSDCEHNGVKEHWNCSVCNKNFDTDKESELTDLCIDALGHSYGEWIEEVAPTSENFGIKAHKDCELCGKHFDENGIEITELTMAKIPNEKHNSSNEDSSSDENGGLSTAEVVGVVAGSTVVAGAGGFVVVWFFIKKKSFAELVEAIKKVFKIK